MNIFEGDGRIMLQPPEEFEKYGIPLPMRRAQARWLVKSYEINDYFSPSGGTLWIFVMWWRSQGFKCRIEEVREDKKIIGYRAVKEV